MRGADAPRTQHEKSRHVASAALSPASIFSAAWALLDRLPGASQGRRREARKVFGGA